MKTEARYIIIGPKGLHGQPSSVLARAAGKFPEAKLILHHGSEAVPLERPLDVLALGIGQNERVTISAEGDKAGEALARMDALLRDELKIAQIAVPDTGEITLSGLGLGRRIVIGRVLKVEAIKKLEDYPSIDLEKVARERQESTGPGKTLETIKQEIINEMSVKVVNAFRQIEEMLARDPNDISMVLGLMASELKDDILQIMEKEQIGAKDAIIKVLQKLEPLYTSGDGKHNSIYNDLQLLCAQMLAIYYGSNFDIQRELDANGEGIVIVAEDLSPANVALASDPRVVAVIREKGSRKDHLALRLADAQKGVLVRVGNVMASTHDGQTVIVDGLLGQLIINPEPAKLEFYRQAIDGDNNIIQSLARLRGQPAQTLDAHRVALMANISGPNDVLVLEKFSYDGIGLVRTEFFFIDGSKGSPRSVPPSIGEQISFYNQIISAARGREVTFRTIDPEAGDKDFPYFEPLDKRANKGIALCLDEVNHGPYHYCFRDQLKALLQTSGPVKIMFPYVSNRAEFERAMKIVDEISAELKEQGVTVNDQLKFGIMVENRAVLEELANLLQDPRLTFISIGSNDLTASITGLDRYGASASYSSEFDRRVIRAIRWIMLMVAESKREIDVSLCGDMGNSWHGLLALLGLGIRRISFSSSFVDIARAVIASVKIENLQTMTGSVGQGEGQGDISLPAFTLWAANTGYTNLEQPTTPQGVVKYVEQFTRARIADGAWEGLKEIGPLLFSKA